MTAEMALYKNNKGFYPEEINSLKEELIRLKQNYKIIPSEDNSEEYVNFFFIGMYEGREVIYDAVIYTLRLHHKSEIYEIAEHKAAQKFPKFKKIKYKIDENGDYASLDDLEEEIGLFMAEVMDDLEEEEAVKVKEHLELDPKIEYGIGLDAALNVEAITPAIITKFINEFNDGSLHLDPNLYSFQTQEEEEES